MSEIDKKTLWNAVAAGDVDAVRAALATNPRLVAEYEEYNYQPTTLMTMLHVAARWEHTEIMAMLLDAGADIAALAPPKKGPMTPLHTAGRGKGTALRLLLERGADPNTSIKRGPTPLYTAAYNGNAEGCRLLLEAGADPDGRPGSSVPLFAAAMESRIAVIDLLLKAGATLNKKDSKKETALHHAAQRGDVAVNEHLLILGLDPDLPDKKGQTPRELAGSNFSSNNREALQALYARWPAR